MAPVDPPDRSGTTSDLLAGALWELLATAPGEAAGPWSLTGRPGWIAAKVPGTAAGALREARGDAQARWENYDAQDWWWRCVVDVPPGPGGWWLGLEGLATVADVWVGGRHVVHSRNMFRSYGIELRGLAGPTEVVVRCAATMPLISSRRPRPRWKAPLTEHQGWRHLRTSLLGRASSWLVASPIVGPWRPVTLLPMDPPIVVRRVLRARMEGESGVVEVDATFSSPEGLPQCRLRVGDVTAECETPSPARRVGRLRLPSVRRWWPHSHGGQPLYLVEMELDGTWIPLGRVGFRTVEAMDADGGFRLRVNGVPVFVVGACWVPLHPVSLQSRPEAVTAAVRQARDAGLNLVRVVGGTVYEDESFHDACDELGVLVWQDCMLTALDPPEDDAFTTELTAEVTQLADRLAGRPSIAVVCGGDETEQQPVLLGLPPGEPEVRAVTRTIPRVLRNRLPDVPYVTSAPTGGTLPVHPKEGIAHYFGVGAYLHPLSDVRTAGVRFAAACLAFSIPPEEEGVERAFGGAHLAGHDPRWKSGVPRDRTASWDFEDVRDHYVKTVLGVDPHDVRRTDPKRYLDLGRAAVCSVMAAVLSQWRRPDDPCAGAIVLALRDTVPGAGWGLIDAYGRPKAPWYAVRRLLAPTAILVHDEGFNGIVLTVMNETDSALSGRLVLRTWASQGGILDTGQADLRVSARGHAQVEADRLFGVFTDLNHAYKFGSGICEVLHAVFTADDGTIVAEHTALVDERARTPRVGVLRGTLRHDSRGWLVDVTADELAQWVVVSAPGYEPEDAWFHMAPGTVRSVRLTPDEGAHSGPPAVELRALNAYPTSARWDEETGRH